SPGRALQRSSGGRTEDGAGGGAVEAEGVAVADAFYRRRLALHEQPLTDWDVEVGAAGACLAGIERERERVEDGEQCGSVRGGGADLGGARTGERKRRD